MKNYLWLLCSNLLSFSLSAVRVAQLTVDTSKDFSGSCPSSPRSKHQTLPAGTVSPHHQPIIHRTSLQHPTPSSQMRAKQRSWSDLRSPSPQKQLLPSFSKCGERERERERERESACLFVCVCVFTTVAACIRLWYGYHPVPSQDVVLVFVYSWPSPPLSCYCYAKILILLNAMTIIVGIVVSLIISSV